MKMRNEISNYCATILADMKYYLTRKIQRIEWENEDNLEFEQITKYIWNFIGLNKTIFLKGEEKKNWAEKLICNVNVIHKTQKDCSSFENQKIFEISSLSYIFP